MSERIKLEGMEFGDIKVLRYIGDKKYDTVCKLCGEHKKLYGHNIKNGIGVRCTAKQQVLDITDKQFGELTAIKYAGNKKWLCKCSCGKLKVIRKANLINGSTKTCGHNTQHYDIEPDMVFGEWLVLNKEGYKWKCECSCGKIGLCTATDLVNGKTTSCGHNTNAPKDLTDKHFGEWKVLKRKGYGMWECQCSCGTIRNVRAVDLTSGKTTSCGCKKGQNIRETLYERYGEISPNKVYSVRTPEQIAATLSKENMLKFLDTYDYKLTSIELSEELGLGLSRTLVIIHQFSLESKIIVNPGESSVERNIATFINSIYTGTVITKDRDVLQGKELDIYLPNKKLAIEVNGDYWHSSIYKDKKYHQDKTIACAKLGIRLIHIFEHEWKIDKQRDKIKNLLNSVLNNTKEKIFARNTEVVEITHQEACEFEDKYHLQNMATSSINIALKYENQIVGVMTLGLPRFSTEVQYELIRLCYSAEYNVVGGSEKMFKYFIDKYIPNSVLTYCDISKFTGNIYTKLGFKVVKITSPNYKWVSTENVLNRYQTQKHKLLEKGLGTPDQTEDEIMEDLGFLKIYDAGNLKLLWERS